MCGVERGATSYIGVVIGAALAFAFSPAGAATVHPDVIFGTGASNGLFTVSRQHGVELGLRARLFFNENNRPQNIFNWDGAHTYSFTNGAPGGIGFATRPFSTRTSSWNFEWSINSDVDGTRGDTVGNIDDLTYQLLIDYDPSAATDFFTYDPIHNVRWARYAFGDNSTGNGAGTVATNQAEYELLRATTNVAQHTQNLEWYDRWIAFDNSVPGLYEIRLRAYGPLVPPPRPGIIPGEPEFLGEVAITVEVNQGQEPPVAPIPVPASLPLFLAALGLAGLLRARRGPSSQS